ncbi:MAG: nucleotide exchange factor GrpE, partial [Clostridia bacterium]|nr:nucleotide exchange factor GrpE [Clostridia bacterium]
DNFRKRTAREKDGIYADAYGDCITAILPVVDNLERALVYTEGDKVVEGVRMTMNQLSVVLKKLGIEVIPTEVFDPMMHNAVMHEENEELGEGVITEVYQKGYKKGDRVIRYAMVKVAN